MSERYLITGASRGIGRAIAELLAADGVELLLHGRDTAALEDTCSKVTGMGAAAEPIVAELADLDGVDKVVQAADGPDKQCRDCLHNQGSRHNP